MAHEVLNIKNAEVTIDGTTVGDAVSIAAVNQTSTDLEWIPVSGATQAEVGEPTYTVALTFGQDFTAGSLTQLLFDGHGSKAQIVITPKGGATPSITATVTLKAPATLGGPVGIATSTAEMKVDGKPVIAWATTGTV